MRLFDQYSVYAHGTKFTVRKTTRSNSGCFIIFSKYTTSVRTKKNMVKRWCNKLGLDAFKENER